MQVVEVGDREEGIREGERETIGNVYLHIGGCEHVYLWKTKT